MTSGSLFLCLVFLSISSTFARFAPHDEPEYSGPQFLPQSGYMIPLRSHHRFHHHHRLMGKPVNEIRMQPWTEENQGIPESKPFFFHTESRSIHDNINGLTKDGMARAMVYAIPNHENVDDKVVSLLVKFKADGYMTVNIPKSHHNASGSETSNDLSKLQRLSFLISKRHKRDVMSKLINEMMMKMVKNSS